MKTRNLLLPALILSLAVSTVEARQIVPALGSVTINGASNYVSEGNGAVVYSAEGGRINLSGVFQNNQANATYYGGGVAYSTNGGSIVVENASSFINNKINTSETGQGGAIAAWGASSVTIGDNVVFRGNGYAADGTAYANIFGGALYTDTDLNNPATLVVGDNVVFDSNVAGLSSGAMFLGDTNATFGENLQVTNNKSLSYGGGIYIFGQSDALGTSFTLGEGATFIGNSSGKGGGAIFSYANVEAEIGKNATFINNSAQTNGGAIYSQSAGEGYESTIAVDSSTFTNNQAVTGHGGAIFSDAESLNITGGTFDGNHAADSGGAIYTTNATTISDVEFKNNYAESANGGGAIKFAVNDATQKVIIQDSEFNGNYVIAEKADSGAISIADGNVDIINTDFIGNKAEQGWGGAIYAYKASDNVNITDCLFEGNEAHDIGAIGSFTKDGTMTITNTHFISNKVTGVTAGENASDGGGALFTGSESTTIVKDSLFRGNTSTTVGGAIATRAETDGNNVDGKLEIINTIFDGNEADGDGGAIYNAFHASVSDSDRVTVSGAVFKNNISGGNGGAIYNAPAGDTTGNAVSNVIVTDTSFESNSVTGSGGAIYASGDVNITANGSDIVFKDNSASDGGDIFMASENSNINVAVAADKTVSFESGISGVAATGTSTQGYNVNITGDGTFGLSSYLKNANVSVTDAVLQLNSGYEINENNNHITMNDGSTLSTINNQIDTFDSNLFTVNGSAILAADIDLTTGAGDNIGASLDSASTGTFEITEINVVGAIPETASSMKIDLLDALGLADGEATISDDVVISDVKNSIQYLKGSIENGMLTFGPAGKGLDDFNPSVLVSPVAAQLGGYFTQLNSYDQAFRNVDLNMLYTKKERQVMKMQNKYAISDQSGMKFNLSANKSRQDGVWSRPFAAIETVRLDGGPRVNNTMYGSYFGADSDLISLENGGEVQYSVYAGYNGSHQSFRGNSIYQNGGTLGISGVYYKEAFFSALTANVGASVADASTMFGSEDFTMLMSGIASKTGYNWELKDGRFIIQPNLLFSYSFVHTFDYTNAAGVRMDSNPLHALHIAPGVRFIANTKRGWQPYVNVSMNWNILDETSVTAAQTSLPDMSVKPYVSYGVGVQKRWGERFTGFLQAMVRSGGRNGIAFATGFKFAIGKEPAFNPHAPKKVIKSL